MTEPDYADILLRAAGNAPLIQELTNALRCALAMKGALEIANGMLAEREKMLRTVLEPFADASRKTDRAWDDNRRVSSLNYEDLRVKHLRAAEMALT